MNIGAKLKRLSTYKGQFLWIPVRGIYCGMLVLRFYGPVNPMGSCWAWSVYLTTRLLGRLSPVTSIVHILLPETDNCPSWISGRERMTVENISWSISTKECCRPWRGLNPWPPGLQSDGASNWATKAGLLWNGIIFCNMTWYKEHHMIHGTLILLYDRAKRVPYPAPICPGIQAGALPNLCINHCYISIGIVSSL